MAAGINFAFAADVRSFLTGTKDVEKGMERVGDSLDDIARDGDEATRKLQADLEKTAREGKDSSDKLERGFKDSFDTLRRESRDAGRDAERNVKRSFDDGSDATGDFKDEAKQNFAEVTSSFKGDMDSVADLAQGTFGGLAATGGPIGLAAGGIAALGGLFYNSWKTNTEKVQQRVEDMYTDLLESGQNYLSDQFVQDEISKIVTGAEDAAVPLARAREEAATLNIELATVVAAYAGQKDAIKDVDAAIQGVRDQVGKVDKDGLDLVDSGDLVDINKIEANLRGVSDATQTAADKAGIAREAMYLYGQEGRDLKDALDASIGYYGGRTWTTTVKATADTSDAERQMRDFLSKRYEATAYINTRPGVKYW